MLFLQEKDKMIRMIKRCLNCSGVFSTNKTESNDFCSKACENEFNSNRMKYIYSKEERIKIKEI